MKIKINRTQTNRSKKKPIFRYHPDPEEACCSTLECSLGGIIVFAGYEILPALRGRAISAKNYSYCPWCGDKFEFVNCYLKDAE